MWALSKLSLGALALALDVAPGGCNPRVHAPECDTELRHDAGKVAGRVDAGKLGVTAETAAAAVREVDAAVERDLSRWRSLCLEYRYGALAPDEYRSESRSLRERMEKLERLLRVLERAPDAPSYQAALKQIYVLMVPAEQAVDLRLDLAVLAQRPGEAGHTAVPPNGAIASGTRVYFTVRTSAEAHVYLFQESPSGEINVVFPHPHIPAANPLPAGQDLRIPPAPGFFTLQPEGVGREQIHLVASLDPLARLEAALAGPQPGASALVCAAGDRPGDPGTECGGAQARTFGLAAPGDVPGVSMRVETTAGARSLHQIFGFQHTP